MKATGRFGQLNKIPNCKIVIDDNDIEFYILPEISDQKSSEYSDENVMGRSFPIKTYNHGSNRSINIELHFIALKEEDITRNLEQMRIIQSATYPRDASNGAPYMPPPVCEIICGKILGDDGVCAVLKSYSVKFPTDQVFDEETMLPYKFDMSTTWEVVYSSANLPGMEKIISDGS